MVVFHVFPLVMPCVYLVSNVILIVRGVSHVRVVILHVRVAYHVRVVIQHATVVTSVILVMNVRQGMVAQNVM